MGRVLQWRMLVPMMLFAGLGVADRDLVFPYVGLGDAGVDNDEWKDFHGRVMDVQNGLTTYSVGCATDPCAGWANLPEFTYTVAIGPNTFDMKYTDEPVLSTHTACTFTGSPATAASCEMTNAGTIAHSTLGYEYHFTVPGWTGSGNWDLWNVQSATLRVVDGTVAASGSATSGAVSGSGSRSGSAMVTPAPTTGTGVSGSGLAQASSTASTGAVVRTGVPGWLVGVGMGVAAGAVLGV